MPTTVSRAFGRKRKATSKVWLDFNEMFTIRNGKKVRYGAKCKYCSTEYSGKSSSGTGHLKRHALVCGKKTKLIVCLNPFCSTTLMVLSIIGSTRSLLLVLNFVA
jgi:hypothetical protein